jgi:hypothetical protein
LDLLSQGAAAEDAFFQPQTGTTPLAANNCPKLTFGTLGCSAQVVVPMDLGAKLNGCDDVVRIEEASMANN